MPPQSVRETKPQTAWGWSYLYRNKRSTRAKRRGVTFHQWQESYMDRFRLNLFSQIARLLSLCWFFRIRPTITEPCSGNTDDSCFSFFLFFLIGIRIYSLTFTLRAFSKRLTPVNAHIHTHTDGGVDHARRQPARQEQLGWGVLARGHHDAHARRSRGSKSLTFRLPVNPLYLLS